MADPQTASKECLLLKINTVTKFLLFKIKYVIVGGYWHMLSLYYPNAWINL